MVLDNVRQWSGILYLDPERFIDTEYDWEDFDLEEWSENEYRWESDDWYGFKDVAKPARETIETGRGDCDCYAVVAMNDRYHAEADTVGVGFLYHVPERPDTDLPGLGRVKDRLTDGLGQGSLREVVDEQLEGLMRVAELGHVIAYDEDKVYSSGNITEETPEEFKEREGYALLLKREL